MCALPDLQRAGIERLLVVNGDTPLLTPACLSDFWRATEGTDLAFASLRLPDPGAFGRVVRKNGAVAAVVEAKDYDAALYGPASGEVNAGWYAFSLPALAPLVPRLAPAGAGGEYYLTELIGLAAAAGLVVAGIDHGGAPHLLGVNTPAELAAFEERLRRTIVERLLDSGVIMHAPDLIRVGPEAEIEPGAELSGPCDIFGASRIAAGASVAAYCVLRDVAVAEGAEIRSFCHLEEAVIGPDCRIGPYARLRPGAVVEARAHVGNFVEVKNSRLGAGAKANHLAYLGDARIGPDSNIGAGAITCNYDGAGKHATVIGAGAFIGSNASLVAPVNIGDGAVVGAGSTITGDVPAAHLGIARAAQKVLPRKPKMPVR
jgi:bifunctional UDP-N-acetylglucosamine pyrophosphorylase/glucosamine-1-phosphate N-acetyltransferase